MDVNTIQEESPQEVRQERTIYRYFWLSVMLKGLLSALEIAGGILVFLIPPAAILAITNFLTQGELAEEPYDFIAIHIQSAAQALISASHFVVIYLLSRGVIKLFLVVALLKNYQWAYPASLVVLGLFMLYQVYQMIVSFSAFVLFITLFDVIVVFFIWKEYQIVKAHHGQQVV